MGAPTLTITDSEVRIGDRQVAQLVDFASAASPPDLSESLTRAVEAARGPEYVEWSNLSQQSGELPEHTRYEVQLSVAPSLAFEKVAAVLRATHPFERVFAAVVRVATGIGAVRFQVGDVRRQAEIDQARSQARGPRPSPGRLIPPHAVVVVTPTDVGVGRGQGDGRDRMADLLALRRAIDTMVTGHPQAPTFAVDLRIEPDVTWQRVVSVLAALPGHRTTTDSTRIVVHLSEEPLPPGARHPDAVARPAGSAP